ncbi:MAG: Type 1 glutamine amidotransferase-like domain-containing protein [Erysipelotrichales bacterium]
MKKIILTSSFSDTYKLIDEDLTNKKIAFIPTASKVEEMKDYVEKAKQAFESMQAIVEIVDIDAFPIAKVQEKIEKADVIYVSGGNTFFLLDILKRTGMDEVIINEINKGKLYIGESAGAMILSENIEYVETMDDASVVLEKGSYDALNEISFYPLPHYKEFPFEQETIDILNDYQDKVEMIPITNSQIIVVNENEYQVK